MLTGIRKRSIGINVMFIRKKGKRKSEVLHLRKVAPSATRSPLLVLASKILVFFLFYIKYVLPMFDFFIA